MHYKCSIFSPFLCLYSTVPRAKKPRQRLSIYLPCEIKSTPEMLKVRNEVTRNNQNKTRITGRMENNVKLYGHI